MSWKVTDDANVWEFKLRPNVKFHNGNAFNADDVVFSLERARQPTSDMKGLLTSVDKVTKVDDLTVHIKTKGPNPLLPNNLSDLFIMDKEWSEANNVQKPQDFKNKEENFSVRNANGTGPFQLVSREPDVKTVMKRNDSYWGIGTVPLEITELVYIPIKADATRLAALLSGEVDFVQDVPVQDIERLKSQQNLRVNIGPENRTIFFGMDVASADLKGDSVQGKNPFADKKVRQAHEHGAEPAGDPARRHARAVGADRRHHAAVRQRLDQGTRRGADGRRQRGQEAAGRRGLSERLQRHAALPERPLRQRRSDLPGGGRHVGPDRRQGEPRLAVEVDPLPADPEEPAGDRILPARAGACRHSTPSTSSRSSITRGRQVRQLECDRAIPMPRPTR